MSWREALPHVDADRTPLVEYAGQFTSDLVDAERAVDEAIVAVLGRGRGSRAPDMIGAAVRHEIRSAFGRRGGRLRPADELASPPQDPEQRVHALGARVRRRRVARAAIIAIASVGLVGLGAAGVFGVVRLASAEAPAPEPTTAAPTPTPTPSHSEVPEPAILGPVTVGPTIPSALPLREGMLEAAGPGWSLVQYENEEVDGSLIYLVSPDGDLYEVPTPLAGPESLGGTLMEWLPGSTLVTMVRASEAGMWWSVAETDVVDLLTGERLLTVHHTLAGRSYELAYATVSFIGDGSTDLLVFFEEYAGESARSVLRTVRLGLDGTERATIDAYHGANGHPFSALSPDGTRLALNQDGVLRVIRTSDFSEVSTLTSPYPDRPEDCGVAGWAGPDRALLTCWAPETEYYDHPDAWIAPLDGGRPTKIVSVTGWSSLDGPWQVGDHVVAYTHDEDGGVLQFVDGVSARSSADLPMATTSAGGLLYGYYAALDGPYGDQALVAVDPFAGTVVELFGAHGEYESITAVVTHGDR